MVIDKESKRFLSGRFGFFTSRKLRDNPFYLFIRAFPIKRELEEKH